MEPVPALVSTQWLNDHLDDDRLRILDASVHLPDTGRNAHNEYLQEHIPGAVFCDLEKIADPDNPRPRKVPPRGLFESEISKLGIDNDTYVIAYDTLGLYSAARVWWLFRLYGYDRVSVLDGGLKAWKIAGLPVEAGDVRPAVKIFKAPETRDLLALWRDVERDIGSDRQILDARTAGRWAGTEIDRYPGARAGHIPGSKNLYWANLLDPDSRRFLSPEIVRKRFDEAGFDFSKPATLSCGSGLTACILALGLDTLGHRDWRVYDGSWDEWGRNKELPVEVSEQRSQRD